jgi:hypothetical protein
MLPRELTDVVLEYVLLAEEILPNPGTHEETFVRCGKDAYIWDDTESEESGLESEAESDGGDDYC